MGEVEERRDQAGGFFRVSSREEARSHANQLTLVCRPWRGGECVCATAWGEVKEGETRRAVLCPGGEKDSENLVLTTLSCPLPQGRCRALTGGKHVLTCASGARGRLAHRAACERPLVLKLPFYTRTGPPLLHPPSNSSPSISHPRPVLILTVGPSGSPREAAISLENWKKEDAATRASTSSAPASGPAAARASARATPPASKSAHAPGEDARAAAASSSKVRSNLASRVSRMLS